MGSSSSTLNSNVLERMATSAMVNTLITCTSDSFNDLKVDGDVENCNISQNADSKITDCSDQENLNFQFQSQMLAQIANQSVMNPPSIFAGEVGMFTQSTSDISEVVNAITQTNVNDFMKTNVSSNNKLEFNSCNNSTISQTASTELNHASLVSKINENFQTSIEAKATNTSTITSSLGNLLTAIILVAVILVILYFVYLMIKNRKSGGGGSGSGNTTNVYVDGKKQNLKGKSKSKIAETSV